MLMNLSGERRFIQNDLLTHFQRKIFLEYSMLFERSWVKLSMPAVHLLMICTSTSTVRAVTSMLNSLFMAKKGSHVRDVAPRLSGLLLQIVPHISVHNAREDPANALPVNEKPVLGYEKPVRQNEKMAGNGRKVRRELANPDRFSACISRA